MNLICLDIDGVLNSHVWWASTQCRESRARDDAHSDRLVAMLDPRCVDRLNTIVEEHYAYILITSTWRSEGLKPLQRCLGAAGLKEPEKRIIGLTESLPRGWVKDGVVLNQTKRGLEVEAWVLQSLDPKVVRLVFLDDDGDFGRFRKPCWVRTTLFSGPIKLDPMQYGYQGPYSGLQDEHVDQVRDKFMRQRNLPAGRVLARVPNPAWTDEALKKLYGQGV